MSDLHCADGRRRRDVRTAPLFGLDYAEVTDPRSLDVFFLGKAPKQVRLENVRIAGGRRIRGIAVTGVRVFRQKDPTLDDRMEISLDRTGDFSDYTVSLVKLDDKGNPTDHPMDGFDPLYSSVVVNFKANCPTDLDCKPGAVCPPTRLGQPEINYLAKDYNSFRKLILDRMAVTMPAWRESHVPDIGIMLVEVLAYAGDYLSYYQDAVATEAYLNTARQRISVRRHVRLVDYQMHEGCNARAWVTVKTDKDTTLDPPFFFTTALPGKPNQRVFQQGDLARLPADSYEVYQALVKDPAKKIPIYKAHSEIGFYTWGDTECCLAAGATSATLTDEWVAVAAGAVGSGDGPSGADRALHLEVGDVLIFEEVIGPGTGHAADADPTHRHAVRLTKVTRGVDPLYHPIDPKFGAPVVEIEWCREDALPFPLCLSVKRPAPDCTMLSGVSVARGNVILVDHGMNTGEPLGTVPADSGGERCACDCEPAHTATVPGKFCPRLKDTPLTFSVPIPPCGCASVLIAQDPRQALPTVSLTGAQDTPQGRVVTTWTPTGGLLESGAEDLRFVVEMDDENVAHLRFGDGDLGRMPEAGTVFDATYRIGNGTVGNVGAETITCLVFGNTVGNAGKLEPRNPLPATGGRDREPVEEVKLFAPGAFHKVLERAITANDYATLAADNARRLAERAALIRQALAVPVTQAPQPEAPEDRAGEEEEADDEPMVGPEICAATFVRLQGAKARRRWTGSWNEVFVAVDPMGTEEAAPELLTEIGAYLEPYRRIGDDVRVQQAQYVGIDLALHVCVLPEYLRGHVEAALLDVLSNRVLPDGTKGMFHPDNLTFGSDLYVSRIVAAAQALPGVQNVEVMRLERYEIGEPPLGVESAAEEIPPGGVLSFGPFEIPRLDNDPNYPENGRLTLDLGGGR